MSSSLFFSVDISVSPPVGFSSSFGVVLLIDFSSSFGIVVSFSGVLTSPFGIVELAIGLGISPLLEVGLLSP